MKIWQSKQIFIVVACLCSSKMLFSQNSHDINYGTILEEIRISGARFTVTEIITRELASQVGQPYIRKNADRDYARLDKLDIFSSVKITPIEESDGIILNVEVQEIYPYLPFLTYQVTDENGLSLGPGFQSVSLFGQDIFVTALARFGDATNVLFFLENPWFAGNHLSYTLEVTQQDRRNKLDDFNEISTEINVLISSYLGEQGRIGGRFSFLSVKSDSIGRTLSADRRDNLPTIGFFVGYDSRDLWSNPHRGWWNQFEVSKSGGFFGADNDYWGLTVDIRRFIPVINRHTLGLFSLTTLRAGDVGEEISPVEDFHIGGTNSVRGWDIDARGGAKNQFINSAEYYVTILEPKLLRMPLGLTFDIGLQLALFGDLGIVWNKSSEFETDNFIGGYGFGIRFLVPFVNQFRFDFGFGEPGRSMRVHIGAFEKPVAQRFRVR